MSRPFDLVVASHLRWNFVWQRPQQLLSRLAQSRRILFIEEPIVGEPDDATMPSLHEAAHNVFVLAPRVSRPDGVEAPIWSDQEAIGDQVSLALRLLRFRERGLWLYTPLPEFLIDVVKPNILVFDVMDELANFKFAPAGLRDQEARMLRRADVVFTGGASLFEAKKPFNPNTHLFASGVDEAHYAKACLHETEIPEWMETIPSPRAAYIGVIDERMDYEIIDNMARRRPDLQFLMVGPIVKVDPAALPQSPNLHYVGQKSYEELPGILKGADVCLMPFARNDATKFISPTKTLEYMATHRPIVSTPIRDVERFYSDIVYLAADSDEFVLQIDATLNESAYERAMRQAREERILSEHAWDAIAANMNRLMETAYVWQSRIKASAGARTKRPIAPVLTQSAGSMTVAAPASLDTVSGS